MHDLICGVIDYCAWSYTIGKNSLYDKLLIKKLKKYRKDGIKEFFYTNFYLKDNLGVKLGKLSYSNGIADISDGIRPISDVAVVA